MLNKMEAYCNFLRNNDVAMPMYEAQQNCTGRGRWLKRHASDFSYGELWDVLLFRRRSSLPDWYRNIAHKKTNNLNVQS